MHTVMDWTVPPPKFICWSPKPLIPQKVTEVGDWAFKEVIRLKLGHSVQFTSVALSCPSLCNPIRVGPNAKRLLSLHKKEISTHRDKACAQRDNHVKRQQERSHMQAKEALDETKPATPRSKAPRLQTVSR